MHIDQPLTAMQQAAQTRNPIKKLYFWTLHWADTKYALPALIFVSFIESSFFPIPPDVLLLAMCFGRPKKWFTYAFWCTVASVAGGVFGWYIGYGLWEAVGQPIVKFYHGEAVIEKVRLWYDQYGFWGVLAAAVTPIPYKVFTIASGMMHFDLGQLIFASILGRGLRFFAVALLIRLMGAKVKHFLEKNFELCTVIFTVLAIGGFAALKFLR